MSWASKRRFLYLFGIFLFFGTLIGAPLAYKYFTIPPTCFDGIQNQGETAIDKGGPCLLLDEATLAPHAILWARSFRVRDGSYNAVAYIQNPNQGAGVMSVPYRFGLYDSNNILIVEQTGTTYIMSGGVTPVFAGGIDTGNLTVAHTYFSFTDTMLWQRVTNPASAVTINNIEVTTTSIGPRISAIAKNTSFTDITNLSFAVTVFDGAGNAINTSSTKVDRLAAGASIPIVFTWPDPFTSVIGRIDIMPVHTPILDPVKTQ